MTSILARTDNWFPSLLGIPDRTDARWPPPWLWAIVLHTLGFVHHRIHLGVFSYTQSLGNCWVELDVRYFAARGGHLELQSVSHVSICWRGDPETWSCALHHIIRKHTFLLLSSLYPEVCATRLLYCVLNISRHQLRDICFCGSAWVHVFDLVFADSMKSKIKANFDTSNHGARQSHWGCIACMVVWRVEKEKRMAVC